MSTIKLNLGCHNWPIAGWVNIDKDPNVIADVHCDVRELPYEDASVDEIYAGHLLEHFTLEEIEHLLTHWNLKLKKDGIITITVPNTEKALEMYNDGRMNLELLNQIIYGTNDRELQNHHSVMTPRILMWLMTRHFRNVKEIADCEPVAFKNIEWQTIVTGNK